MSFEGLKEQQTSYRKTVTQLCTWRDIDSLFHLNPSKETRKEEQKLTALIGFVWFAIGDWYLNWMKRNWAFWSWATSWLHISDCWVSGDLLFQSAWRELSSCLNFVSNIGVTRDYIWNAMVSRNNYRNWWWGETGLSVKWVRRSWFEGRYGMIFGKKEMNGSCRPSARRSKSHYVQSSPVQSGVRGSGHVVLGKTKLTKLPVGKVILRDHGRSWTTPPPA